MHLIVSLYILAFGVVLISSVPFEENLKSDLVEKRDSSEDPVASFRKRGRAAQRNNPIPLAIARLFVKAHNRGYCLRRLSSLVPGTRSGFKGWKRKYHSGYVAAANKLYLFFRCAKNKVVRPAKRVRREPSHTEPTFPPRPCVNGPMAGSGSGEEQSGSGDTMEDDPESGDREDQSESGRREERKEKKKRKKPKRRRTRGIEHRKN